MRWNVSFHALMMIKRMWKKINRLIVKVEMWLHVYQHDMNRQHPSKTKTSKNIFSLFDIHMQSAFQSLCFFPKFSNYIQNFNSNSMWMYLLVVQHSSISHIWTFVVNHTAATNVFMFMSVLMLPKSECISFLMLMHHRMEALFAGG